MTMPGREYAYWLVLSMLNVELFAASRIPARFIANATSMYALDYMNEP